MPFFRPMKDPLRSAVPYACALVALAVFAASPARASTGFKSSGTLDSSNVGKTLYDGTVYVVPQNATISRSTPYTALYVADGATAVIYVPTGVTLTVKGGNAKGTEGAGAGIRVPPASTLVVTGGGTLNVTGGNAANGASGGSWRQNGSWNGSADVGSSNLDSTGGGNGGNGGGGASAAIGGVGGNGGSGGSGGDGFRVPTKHASSANP